MLLKVGSQGETIVKLQTKLGINNDGVFGPGTEKAVKSWQQANGLIADGIVGNATWAKLFGEAPAFVIPDSDFNLEALRGTVPDTVIAQIPATAAKFGISNNLRLAHFLSQCAHESGSFKWVFEFASGTAYEGRKDLGNTEPGDGVRFKGLGSLSIQD